MSEDEIRAEFEGSGGPVQTITIVGQKASIVFEEEKAVDAVLELCTSKAGKYPADEWLRYREKDQGRYRIKMPVPRPPKLGEHAALFSEDEQRRLHNTFFVADRAPGAEVGSGLDLEYFKKLIQKLVKESGGKPLNDKALVELFNHADEDKSGYVDFYEFLELYGQVKAGKVESLGGSGLFRSMMKKKEKTPEEIAALELTPKEIERAEKIFKARAKDSNGEVSKEEFKALIKQLIASGNKSADKPAQVPKDKDLNAAFTQADTDKSGMVDLKEFMQLYRDVKAGKVKGLGGGMISGLASGLTNMRKKKDSRTNLAIIIELQAAAKSNKYAGTVEATRRFDSKVQRTFIAQLKVTLQLAQYPSANAEMMGGLTLTGNANSELRNASILVHVTGLPDLATIEALAKQVLAKGTEESNLSLLGQDGVEKYGLFRVISAEAAEPVTGFVEDPRLLHGVLTDDDIIRLDAEYKKVRFPTENARTWCSIAFFRSKHLMSACPRPAHPHDLLTVGTRSHS